MTLAPLFDLLPSEAWTAAMVGALWWLADRYARLKPTWRTVASQLELLRSRREAGVVSVAEFERQRVKLLHSVGGRR